MIEFALIQSCPTLIYLLVFIGFPIIMRRILSWNFISYDPFLHFNFQVALLVGS